MDPLNYPSGCFATLKPYKGVWYGKHDQAYIVGSRSYPGYGRAMAERPDIGHWGSSKSKG